MEAEIFKDLYGLLFGGIAALVTPLLLEVAPAAVPADAGLVPAE